MDLNRPECTTVILVSENVIKLAKIVSVSVSYSCFPLKISKYS